MRRYEKGATLKNLVRLAPLRNKARLHKNLVPVLLDIFEAIEGIDLAVIDATRTYSGLAATRPLNTKALVMGRDAIAVEAVGVTLVGLNPAKMPVIQEAMGRGPGEDDRDKIDVLGESIESIKERLHYL